VVHEYTPEWWVTTWTLQSATAFSPFKPVINDSIGLTDIATVAHTHVLTFTDGVGLTDTPLVASRYQTFTDQAGLTDTPTRVVTYDRTFTDDAGLTDTPIVQLNP